MTEKLGRYEILEEIGQGGFAVVYRARDRQLDRFVALKELRPTLLADPGSVKDFRQEAKNIARLDHPHVVTIYDVYGAEQRLFIVMQLVDGSSLAKLIGKRGHLSWSETVEMFIAVTAGLDYAHTRHILHRDLKPANILLDSNHGPMLSDFGLAKLIGEAGTSVTAAGGVVGTPHYVAPEVWEGQGTTPQSDIYALGCILYELLIGEKLFPGETPPAVMMAHFRALALPKIWPEGVPSDVADLLATALAKRPADRYATAGEMAEALDAVVKSELTTPQLETARSGTGPVSPPILTTKLYPPPTRPASSVVARPRLIERLNQGLQQTQGLTLISAPAGFGKTTLVSDWLRHSDAQIHTTWLSLDDGDNDPTRFLTYFIAALRQIDPNIGRTVQRMLQSPQPPPLETLMTALINEMSISLIDTRCVLVLDDYHLIDAKPIDNALTFLLDHLPPPPGGIHLVIATRDDPHLPLARLRARGQLIELRATDLRFTASEAAEFLNHVMGLDLSTEDITALEVRTEGWIAGLQLAALALQGTISMQGHKDVTRFIKSFTGSHHFILDYLIEEVLEQQSESVQTFLLKTAVLDRLTGSLCDVLTGHDNGQATLEMLEHANLFIVPLDEERCWYRYHHLFADLLRRRLRQNQPEQVPGLHIRASEWHEQNGHADEAIEHALSAENFERAAHLVEELAETVWGCGEQIKLRRWIEGLPTELVFSKPQLCIFHAWSLFAAGQQDAAERSVQAAEQAIDASTNRVTETELTEQERLRLRGKVAVVRAFMDFFREDVPGIIQHARQALKYLPEQDLTWRNTAAIALGDAYSLSGQVAAATEIQQEALEACKATGNIYMVLTAGLKLAVSLRLQGQLQRALEMCRQLVQLAQDSGMSQSVVAGCLMTMWAELLAELNDMDRAIELGNKGIELTERGGDVAMLGWSYICQVRVLFSRGDMAGAEEIIRKMEKVGRKLNVPPWVTKRLAAWQGQIWLAQGKLPVASQWVAERGLDTGDEPYLQREREYMVLARLCIAQGRLDEATRLLQRLLETAEEGGRLSYKIEILILRAMALEAGRDTNGALAALEQALVLAEPGGYIRIFVDEGPPMAHLLYEAVTCGVAPDYVRRLLAAFPVTESEQTAPSKTQAPKSELVEPLSERELEVLQLLAEGLTNQEIGSRLFLSLNTVKVHTRNIYGKLDAHSRSQAVARARALGVLPSI
jgi:LuxR family maltose regulon positive regulatory protein